MSKTHAVLAAAAAIAMVIATMPTPAAAQYNYGPPPIGGPIGAILDSIFGPLPPPPPPYYDPDEYGPPPCYGCPPPPPTRRRQGRGKNSAGHIHVNARMQETTDWPSDVE
jgi:hypothetical protein